VDREPPPGLPSAHGFRLLPHTADCAIEAWGPDRVTCMVEAVGGLVSAFADVGEAAAAAVLPVAIDPGPDADMLVRLLEEVIYTAEVFGQVPLRVHLADTEDGGVAGDMEVVPAAQATLIGPVPKAVSYHQLEMGEKGGAWRCRVVVDV